MTSDLAIQLEKAIENELDLSSREFYKELQNKNDYFINYPKVTKIDLSNNKISNIPDGLFTANKLLEKIYLNENEIESLPADFLNDLRHLRIVKLTSNRIKQLEKDLFKDKYFIEKIYLDGNQIQTLPEELLNDLKLLGKCNFSRNQIEFLDSDLFKGLKQLKVISFCDNKLTKLPPSIFDDNFSLEEIYFERNNIEKLPLDLFTTLTNLRKISFRDNKLTELPLKLFDFNPNLEEILLDNNQIKTLDANLFKNLKQLKVVSFSENKLKELPNLLFENNHQIEEIYFQKNRIESLNGNLLSKLKQLKLLFFSENKLKSLPSKFFYFTENLVEIYFQNNLMDNLPSDLFNQNQKLECVFFDKNLLQKLPVDLFKGITNVKIINLDKNQLKSLDKNQFDDLINLEKISVVNNQLTQLPTELFSTNKKLKYLNFKSNKIDTLHADLLNGLNGLTTLILAKNLLSQIPETFFTGLESLKYVDLRDNNIKNFNYQILPSNNFTVVDLSSLQKLNLNDLDLVFNNLFHFYNQFEFEKNIFLNEKIRKSSKEIIKNDYDLSLIRSTKNDIITTNLYMIYSSKSSRVSDVSFRKPFNIMIEYLNSFKWNLLDFLAECKNFDSYTLICLQRNIDNRLNEKGAYNYDFRFSSADSILALCRRNDTFLFDSFFPKESFLNYITNLQAKLDIVLSFEFNPTDKEMITKYIFDEDFFLDVDYENCFRITLDNNNEKLAVYLLIFIRFSILNAYLDQNGNPKENYDYKTDIRFKKIISFQSTFLKVYLKKIFTQNWSSVIDFLLNNSTDSYFIDLINDSNEEFSLFSCCKSKDNTDKKDVKKVEEEEPNILVLMSEYKNQDFLRHEKIRDILHEKWKLIPKFNYYLNLSFYLVFLIFYSISTEKYLIVTDDPVIKYVPFAFIVYFLVLEIIQLIDSIFSKKFLIYITSFKNISELTNFSLCIAALFLTNENYEARSSLYSVTILFSYFIFIFRMNKAWKIGPYVNVIGNIILKSFGLLFLVFVCMVGFLLSFRNRSRTILETDNTIQFFNATFEETFLKILTMGVGSLGTDGMGVSDITGVGFINCALLVIFIIIMPVLLINIFTGISIDEVQRLIENSEAEIVLTKIEYVMKLEDLFKKKLKRHSILKPIYAYFFYFEKLLSLIYRLFDLIPKLLMKIKYVEKSVENYRENDLQREVYEKKNELDSINKKMRSLLIEFNQLSINFADFKNMTIKQNYMEEAKNQPADNQSTDLVKDVKVRQIDNNF